MQSPRGTPPSFFLPQELVDRIIDEVASLPVVWETVISDPSSSSEAASDSSIRPVVLPSHSQVHFDRSIWSVPSPGLLVCAQVSRAFRARSRELIFASVVIRLDTRHEESVRAKAFWGLMEGEGVPSPSGYGAVGPASGASAGAGLAGLVRSFKIELRSDLGGVERGVQGWMYDDPWTVRILSRLHNLERIAVEGVLDGSFLYAHQWSDLSAALRDALWEVRGRVDGRVQMVRIGEIFSVPADFLLRWRGLKSVGLVGTSFSSTRNEDEKSGDGDVVSLESLETRGCASLLDAVDTLVERSVPLDRRGILGRLRRFRAEPPVLRNKIEMKKHVENVWKIAAEASQTLEDLDLVQSLCHGPQTEAISIGLDGIRLPSLRSIRIQENFVVIIQDIHTHSSGVLKILCPVICCLVDASSDSLEHLVIEISWTLLRLGDPGPYDDYDLQSLNPRTWAALDESLSRVRGFKELDITVTVCYPSAVDWTNREEAGLGHLRDLWTPERSREVFPMLSAISSNAVNLKFKMEIK